MKKVRRLDLRPAATLAGFITLSAAVYYPSLNGEFVSDDLNAIVSNERVIASASAKEIFTTFSWWGSSRGDAPGYRPLSTWTFARQRNLSGLNVTSWHAVNFVLHGVACWLVFLAVLELVGRWPSALWIAAIFCVLPIHTEAVAWVVGRAELLAGIGYCAALLFVLRYRRNGRPAYAFGAALALVAGTFAKESAATVMAIPPLAALVLPGGMRARRRDSMAALAMLTGFLL